MEIRLISCLFLLVNLWHVFGKPRKYYMEDFCGQTLFLREPSIRLKLSMADYKDNMDCRLTIQASNVSSTNPTRLMVVFDELDIEESSSHCSDSLRIRDGHSSESPALSGAREELCGSEKPSGPLFTSREHMTLMFISDAYGNDDGFELFITPFHEGTCTGSEFECNDGQCIGDSLKCDGYDQCGDKSDECMWLLAVIASAICATSAFVVTIVITLCCCRRRKRCCCCCKQKKPQKKPTREIRINMTSNVQNTRGSGRPQSALYQSGTSESVILVPAKLKETQNKATGYDANPPSYEEVMATASVAKSLPTKSHI